jgi:diguanylate cyclase
MRLTKAFAAFGSACTALYAADLGQSVGAFAFLAVGVGGCAALLSGPRVNRAVPARPWLLLGAASAVFLLGALIRPWAAEQTGLAMATADAFTLPGYAFLFLGIAALLRARNSLDRHAVADGLIISLGAGLVSIIAFALPAARVSDRPALVSALAGIYPVLDVVLVLLLMNLAFTTAIRQPSFRLLAAGVGLLLAGDLGYAIIGARGELSGPSWLDLPFLCCYVLFGSASLHPSMVDVGRAVPLPVQSWSWRRLMLLVPALAVPFVLVVVGERSVQERLVLGVGGAGMVVVLLLRASSAVAGYARAQEVFRYQATHDGLTGLPNRAALTGAVEQLLRLRAGGGGRPVWLFFLDLDSFKLVNDSWGHDAGDRLLAEVARRLRAAAPVGATVARLGGDEFVVATRAWQDEATALADRLMAVLAQPLPVGGADIVVTGSMGLATAGEADTAEGVMRDADTAMYQAKAEGRRRWVVFDPSMREHVRDRVEIELALRTAISRSQLRVHYQPIVRLSDGGLVGAEALLRWDHPVRGPVPPATFIPIAEEAGIIADLGDWVLIEALRSVAAWRRDRIVPDGFWVSVNVSPRQLRDHRVLRTIRQGLDETGLSPAALVLEITESVMLDQSEVTEQVLLELRALGLRLVVDDFGTGFSALGYLRRHPVTGVKVDRGFVDGLGRDAEDEEIVRAVVAMSSALGLSVVAEGVETHVQRGVLISLGVTMGQGMLWGLAVEPGTFARLHGVPPMNRLSAQLVAGNS